MTRGFIALRHRNFRLFFWGQLISLIGTWMQTLGQQWLVYVLTGSALNLGIVSAFQYLPVLLFSLPGGVVVDRVPKRTLIICTQSASLVLALVLGLLTGTHVVQLWHVYLLAFLLGTVNAFDMPARQAFVVEMVGREDLMNAIALNASIFNGSRVVGPAIGAFIITVVGIAGCFFLNALSFVAVIIGLFLMRLPPAAARPAQSKTLGQIGEGLRYIRSDRRVLLVLLLVSFISVFAIPAYTTLMPVVADQILHVGVAGLGTLTSFLALGSVTAAVGLAYTNTPEQRRFFMIGGAATGSTLLLFFSFSRKLPPLAGIAGRGRVLHGCQQCHRQYDYPIICARSSAWAADERLVVGAGGAGSLWQLFHWLAGRSHHCLAGDQRGRADLLGRRYHHRSADAWLALAAPQRNAAGKRYASYRTRRY